MCMCWLGSIRCCRCLLGNESEKYVIENLYDFDLGIITITIDEKEWLAPSSAKANGEWERKRDRDKWASNFRYFCEKYRSFLPMCLFCHFSLACVLVLALSSFRSNAHFIPYVHPFTIFRSIQFRCGGLFSFCIRSFSVRNLFLSKLKYIFLLYLCSVW